VNSRGLDRLFKAVSAGLVDAGWTTPAKRTLVLALERGFVVINFQISGGGTRPCFFINFGFQDPLPGRELGLFPVGGRLPAPEDVRVDFPDCWSTEDCNAPQILEAIRTYVSGL
jgi:hypothetical protein